MCAPLFFSLQESKIRVILDIRLSASIPHRPVIKLDWLTAQNVKKTQDRVCFSNGPEQARAGRILV